MKSKSVSKGISAVVVVHNEDSVIEGCLASLKPVVDEIVVVHDGPCTDNTVKIAKRFTKKVYTTKHKGRSAFNFITALKKTRFDWVLKIDADESLSKGLQKNLRKLIRRSDVDGFSFIHPLWNGRESFTKFWPRKTSLVRKSSISYLAFPGFDASIPTTGSVEKTNFVLFHKPVKNQDVGWKGFREKVLNRYAPSQAKYLLKDFSDFETYNYASDDLPLKIRIRKHLPYLTNALYGFLVFFKQLFVEGAYKEGLTGINVLFKTLIYNVYLGHLIAKEKTRLKK